VLNSTEERLGRVGVETADDARRHARALVQYSDERRKSNLELRHFLYKNLYYNPVVHRPNTRAVQMLADLFRHFLAHPSEMGGHAQKRARGAGRHRAVCDYLAGMTDRYAIQEHERIFGSVGAG
jgi:dGTPase